ncbi:type II inositol 1,4,5-trisphosphate 5-phosphatase [Phlebotomus argentipes]|uniref:type II inositol 1,4,5-trisphosphate 5-phosphatase n=1 Tax=Phlebotomus argentipes TaxID=94469 RepID=UPI002892A948|nr:type II inositol 1,4,5-trisphosphate 5-phosphatase [Phlebotomus argentipes]
MTESVKEIVREKFRQEERVVSIFEAYQLIGYEQQNRLLALVRCHNSYAVFSFALSMCPPTTFVDLTVENFFPIDQDFRIDAPSGGISKLQFRISTKSGQNVFYYYPCQTYILYKYDYFQNDILAAKYAFNEHPEAMDFAWLDSYRREDLSAIDRSIADGRATLKKRESKFREELEKREHEFIVYEPHRFYIATWNVNGQPPNDISLHEWLATTKDPPDLYAIAFQELDLSPKAYTFSENRPDFVWVSRVMDAVHPGAEYEELVSVRLVGMMLIIVIRRDLRRFVKSYTTCSVGTGTLNMMGNKGGVGVSVEFCENFICFVNAHLAAHVHEVIRRKEDHDEILRRMQFEHGITKRSIEEHDHIFWFGDLNYRIIEQEYNKFVDPVAAPGVSRYANQEFIYAELEPFDQLHVEMKRKSVFMNFVEGPIMFQPTYKYDPGTNNWDSSEKARMPAWCDRILWRSDKTHQIVYDSIMALQLSDHKPVYALFLTHVKTRDEEKYKKVHEEVLKTVDKYENDNQPQITVAETDIDFGVIQFNSVIQREILVANNCHLPVVFEFTGKEGKDSAICESWLDIQPSRGRLFTGNSISIKLELHADSKSAWKLHRKQRESGQKVPLDILVLHVENGRDIFITIIGEYRQSCIGFNLETLCQIQRPVTKMNLKEILELEREIENSAPTRNDNSAKADPAEIPRELWFLVDYLFNHGMQTMNLFNLERKFRRSANINEIRDWLNSWSVDVFPGNPYTAAETLLFLLEGTPVPLVHPYEDLVCTVDSYEKCRDIITFLTPQRKIIFIYVCLFLREVLDNVTWNRVDNHRLARIFAPVLLKSRTLSPKVDRRVEDERDDKRVKFLLRLLDNKDFLREFAITDLKVVNRSMPLLDLS